MRHHIFGAAALALTCTLSTPVSAQQSGSRSVVSIYHAVPGHQAELLKWLARQDQISAAAGNPRSQLYVHMDGDSWDYVLIAPATTEAQDAAFDAAAKRMGVPTGPAAGIEFRKHIMSHTDTMTAGPTTAAEVLAALGEK
ncbi:hypothetical protein [Sphingomonas arenae]|uniref:hypothetical protein n=1 Tax=Sphingomonas arenae TaxID=2812555 RepID=UPI001967901C|nr:hypothetical protein [Sphingomonas arenae]